MYPVALGWPQRSWAHLHATMSKSKLMPAIGSEDRAPLESQGRKQLIAFVIVGCLLIPFYRYELGPDGISYLSIARLYANGFWHEAVNAYWGPLYSWILAALLALHVPGILATRVVGLAAGAVALHALSRLSKQLPMAPLLQQIFLWVSTLTLLAFAVLSNTPDLLFTALLLLYTSIIFDRAYPFANAGALCGILGALCFYSKSYGFPFFLTHFCVFNLIVWMRSDKIGRNRVARQFASGLASFFILSSGWILALHASYGGWMLSTTGEFNHRLVGPQSAGYPHLRGLLPVPNEHTSSAWQDPSPAALPSWNIQAAPAHELKLVIGNAKQIVKFSAFQSVLFPVFLVGYVILCVTAAKERWEWIYPVLTICLFTGGYLFLTVQDRYFWFAELLMLLMAFRSIQLFLESQPLAVAPRAALIVIVVLSFAVGPLRVLRAQFRHDARLYSVAESIKASEKLHEPFASCENWAQSAYIAYVVQEPYDGLITAEPDADKIARDLNPDFRSAPPSAPNVQAVRQALSAAHIKELLLWPDCPLDAASLGSIAGQFGEARLIQITH